MNMLVDSDHKEIDCSYLPIRVLVKVRERERKERKRKDEFF
jgi:hypothetical protein